jgi:hypothetical protein
VVDPDWDEAFSRVESYLRAHHLESRVLLNHLATDIIDEARAQVLAQPGLNPVAAAWGVTNARIGDWFAHAGLTGDWADERVRSGGRLALVLANLPGRWPNHFLSPEPAPPDLSAALASGALHAGPQIAFCNMAAAPLEFGFTSPVDARSDVRDWWPTLRDAAGWLMLLGIYGVAWAAAH